MNMRRWGSRRLRWARRIAAPVVLTLMAGLLVPTPVVAAPPADGPTAMQREPSVPVQAVVGRRLDPDPAPDRVITAAPAVNWPKTGVAETDLATGPNASRVGELPVWVGPPGKAVSGQGTPRRVRVELLDRAAASAARADGVLLRVGRVDDVKVPARVRMGVDYAPFRNAFGGDWAARLRLVAVPECALSTPDKAECRPAVVEGQSHDTKAGRVAADVPADGGLFAVTAGPSGSTGDYTASSLAPSATWSAGGSSGDFTWSYPVRTPPSTGGTGPEVTLAYSSGSIDGRTASTNNQPTWLGEGFNLRVGGHVERRYKSCADDLGGNNGQRKTGDLCWGTVNAFVSLGGQATELIRNDADGVWRLKNDNGSRVDWLSTPGINADNNGEHWRITTTDGTQYWFGSRALSTSTWTVPVFGNHSGEDCFRSGDFAGSWCDQAYKWNLDHIVDPRGNTTTFYYQTESNLYGRNLGQAAHSYHRGGWLDHIDYGTNTGVGGSAPARIAFAAEDRCVTPGATCLSSNPGNWPDVPWDQQCAGGTCPDKVSPTFFSQKRLAKITTQVWSGSGYRDVDSWTLIHRFLNPGDTSSAALWLEAIRHSGLVGTGTSVPEVNFNEVSLSNRVDIDGDTLPPLARFRVSSIINETGGDLSVQYSQHECNRKTGTMPSAPESNTMRCLPTYWTPPGSPQPVLDWFHKYVVTSVTEADATGGGRPMPTSYEYLSPPAWHYDDEDGLVPPERKTWSQWHGYQKVGTVTGDGVTGSGEPAPRTRTVSIYLQGMDNDKLPSGRRDIWVPDSEGGTIEDHELVQGMVRETVTYNSAGDNTVVSGQINDPWLSTATATNNRPWGVESAFLARSGSVRNRVALESGGYRRTQVINTFEQGTGLLRNSSDLGDTATANDDRCTRTSYAGNAGAWMLSYPSRVESVGVACSTPASYPQDLLSDVRTYYDNGVFGAAPTKGNVTKTEQAASWSGGTPRYVTVSRAALDVYGRPTETWDAAGERSTMAYTPATGGPVTRTAATNPLGHAVATDLEPAWGQPTKITDANQRATELAYDGLGRLVKVWLPGRNRATQSANSEFEYRVQTTAANVVIAKALLQDGVTYKYSYAFYDGLLRARQTQSVSPGLTGGRIINESFYDSRGLVWKSSGPYFNGAPADVNLVTPVNDNNVPTQTVTQLDGVGRVIVAAFREMGTERWRTTTSYGGDRVHVNPPAGAPATTTFTSARGKATELRQYTGLAPSSSFQATKYIYTDRDELASVTDAASNVWSYSYDLRGLKVGATDPDKGSSMSIFDDAGRLASTTDARNITLAYAYDKLGRKTGMHEGSLSGPKRAEWVFDTRPGGVGLPASSTRFDNGNAYVSMVDGYDAGGRPTGSTVTIPAAEGALARSYQSTATYRSDGSPDTVSVPGVGGLPAETLAVGYSGVGLPATLTSAAAAYVTETGYTDVGELGRLTLSTPGQNVWQIFFYERGTRRLAETKLQRDATGMTQAQVFYSYDPAGNVTRIADKPPVAGLALDHQCFRYDHLRRLTEAWTPNTDDCGPNPSTAGLGGPAPYWHSFRFDAVGNRTTEVQHASGGDTTRTYTYPAGGAAQPHTVRSVSTAKPGTTTTTDTFGYNQEGDTTSRALAGQPGHTLAWDAEGRLASDTVGGQTTSFLYTADGARLLRRDPTNTTLYLGESELRCQRSTGAVTGTRYYTHAGQTVAVRQGGALTWLASDHHGTASFTINPTDLSVTRRRTLPYGGLRGTAPASWPGERGFVGGTIDVSTSLTHIGARDYDPALGRFISVDPIMDVADPQQMHGYAYSNNNPVTFADPTGLWCDSCNNGQGWPDEHGYFPSKEGSDGRPMVDLNSPKYKAGKPMTQRAWKLFEDGDDNYRMAQLDPIPGFTPRKECGDFICSTIRALVAGAVCGRLGGPLAGDVCAGAAFGATEADNHGQDPIKGAVEGAATAAAVGTALRAIAQGVSGLIAKGRSGGPAGEAPAAPTPARQGTVSAANCSFSGDTEVVMADGTRKPIRDVNVGDHVLAADPETGETGPRRVTATHVHQDTVLDLVTEDGAKIVTTEDHPFYNSTDKMWERSDQLDPGDALLAASGKPIRVAGVSPDSRRGATAYNLTILDIHTFYVAVGATSSALVHNTCSPFIPGARYRQDFETSAGAIRITAEVEEQGTTLILRDVTVAPGRGSYGSWDSLRHSLGPAEASRILRGELGAQAASQGYTYLRLTGYRITGPVGHEVDVTIRVR